MQEPSKQNDETQSSEASEDVAQRVKRARSKADSEKLSRRRFLHDKQREQRDTAISPEMRNSVSNWEPIELRLNATPIDVIYASGTVGHITQHLDRYTFKDQAIAIKMKGRGDDLHTMTNMKEVSDGCCIIT